MSRKKKKAAASLEVPALEVPGFAITEPMLGVPSDRLTATESAAIEATILRTQYFNAELKADLLGDPTATPRRRVSGDEVREIRRQQRREERIAEKGY